MFAGRQDGAAGDGQSLDGWPPTRANGRTEPGLQAGSPAALTLTCGDAVTGPLAHTSRTHQKWESTLDDYFDPAGSARAGLFWAGATRSHACRRGFPSPRHLTQEGFTDPFPQRGS